MKQAIFTFLHIGGWISCLVGSYNREFDMAIIGIIMIFSSFIIDIILPESNSQKVDEKEEQKEQFNRNILNKTLQIKADELSVLPRQPIQKDFISEREYKAWAKVIITEIKSYNTIVDLLILSNKTEDIKYSDLLNCREWKFKRLKILVRDGFKCVDCGYKSKSNHVHHLYYIKDEFPWSIDSYGLCTLCNDCHKNRHQNSTIEIFKYENHKLTEANNFNEILFCSRCNGTGYLPQFNHVQYGICFKCQGGSINSSIFIRRLNNFFNHEIDYYNVEELNNNILEYVYSIDMRTYNMFKDVYVSNQYNNNDSYADDLPF
jgi:hypothetical protein